MQTIKTLQSLLLTLISVLMLTFSPAYAAEPVAETTPEDVKFYDVEIIVFKNISVPKGEEINLPTPSPIRSANTLDLSDHESIRMATDIGFTALRIDELRLADIVQSILKSSRYGLLTHTGWRQPGLDQNDSFPVWIKGGKIFGMGYSSIDHAGNENYLPPIPVMTTDTATVEVKQVEVKPAIAQPGLYELEGQIIITLSRYLHTQANLVLRKPTEIQTQIETSPGSTSMSEISEGYSLYNYGLNEKRRMRSKKLHYLDHPQFGMLVLITPYQKPLEPALEVMPEQLQNAPVKVTSELTPVKK